MSKKDLNILTSILIAALTVMVLIYTATKFDIAVALLLVGAVILLYLILTKASDS